MNRKILNAAFVGAMAVMGILAIILFLKPEERKVSEAESEARLKVAEAERESTLAESLRETTIETTTTTTEALTEYEIQVMEVEAYVPEVAEETEAEEEIYYPSETETDFPTEPISEEVETDFSETCSTAETEEATTGVQSNDWGFTDDELWEIARITYLENGCEEWLNNGNEIEVAEDDYCSYAERRTE